MNQILRKSPNDVVLTHLTRTALTRAKKGGFKDTCSDTLLSLFLSKSLPIDKSQVDEVHIGTCHAPSPVYESRAALLAAKFPDNIPVQTHNTLCSSGLMALRNASNSIARGEVDVALAVGYESMSTRPRPTPIFESNLILQSEKALDCAKPMGWTSEMLAERFKVSREKQDEYGLLSHTRASAAQKNGVFTREITPLTTNVLNKETNNVTETTVSEDDGIRHGLAMEQMKKAKPAFPEWGDSLSTGPNSSQVTDGAALAVLMSRKKAEELGAKIVGRHIGSCLVGVEPKIMGVGPVYAIPKLLERFGLQSKDIDLFEINEAFGSMYAYCVETLGLDINRVNVNGGAIALGHPLGATGVRQVVTGVNAFEGEKEKLLITSMCVGSGMGGSALFVTE